MAKKDVLPFASVDAYLRRKGFTCYRVRDYDEPRGARRYYYECPNRKMPRMTFPEAGGWVLEDHFEKIKAAIGLHEEGDET